MTDKEKLDLLDLIYEWARLERELERLLNEWGEANKQQRVIKDKLMEAAAKEMS